MKSLKFELIIIACVFGVFSCGVIFQVAYLQFFQFRQIRQLEMGDNVINQYLKLVETENAIVAALTNACDVDDSRTIQDAALDEVQAKIRTWLQQLLVWQDTLATWSMQTVAGGSSIIGDNYIEHRKRQASAYRNIVSLCRDDKRSEARHLLRIESEYHASFQDVVQSILQGTENQREETLAISRRFFFCTVFGVVLSLTVLIALSTYTFRSVTSNLSLLAKGAGSISAGNLDERIDVKGPSEFTELAESFNAMQAAIRDRDEQIRCRTGEVEALNRELEQRVVDRNRKIERQNQVLEQKNNELEQVLYTASHDLRTPLISIQGFSEELNYHCDTLIKEFNSLRNGESNGNDGLKELLENDIPMSVSYIRNGSKRMEILLDGLLRLTRLGRASLKVEKLDMNTLMKNVTDSLGFQIQEADVKVNIDDLQECSADASLLEQVFSNLIGNAIKYRKPDRSCVITVSSAETDAYMTFTVADNGIGIDPENLEKICDAFYRIDSDTVAGEGLGLAIVSRILDLHNGRIDITSTQDQGSSFTVKIPCEPEPQLT